LQTLEKGNFDPIVVNVWQLYREVAQVSVICDAKDAAKYITGVTYIHAAIILNPYFGNLNALKKLFGKLASGPRL
jgi:hypothetical protein